MKKLKSVNINNAKIENGYCQKLLGVNIDEKLWFEKDINDIYAKAGAKLKTLREIAPFINFEKRKLVINLFFNSQFSFCSLRWKLHSRAIDNKIKRLHERCIRTVCSDFNSTLAA